MPNGQSLRFIMEAGPNPGLVYKLDADVVRVGREVGNDLVINDPEMSRQHARLSWQAGGYVLEDLGSTNGTFVNGERLAGPRALRSGDRVSFGDRVTLLYSAEQATVVGRAPLPEAMVPSSTVIVEAPPDSIQPEPVMPEPVFSEPVFPEPVFPEPALQEPSPQRGNLNWRWGLAGCGCLLILTCVAVVGGLGIYIDTFNLYCNWLGLFCP